MINEKDRIKEIDYRNATSLATHPVPNADSRFYRKFKPELALKNPHTHYRKYKTHFLPPDSF